jgi:hypothetical protein
MHAHGGWPNIPQFTEGAQSGDGAVTITYNPAPC